MSRGIEVAVVHNGIIENHEQLRAELREHGYVFASQTDTEVAAHLIHFHLHQGLPLLTALQATTRRLQGAFALGLIANVEPGIVLCTKRGPPLLVGLADNGTYLASDASALVCYTRRYLYLEDDDVAILSITGARIFDFDAKPVRRPVQQSGLDAQAVSQGGYAHFMLKEIHEQPAALTRTLDAVLSKEHLDSRLWGQKAGALFDAVGHIRILACGTSFYAGSAARYWLEAIAGVTLPGTARSLVLPALAAPLESITQVIALQLLAYHTALYRGLSVDRPRNLAKSVTTE